MSAPVQLQKKARGERPQFLADPSTEKALSITLALAGEVAVLRDRLDTIERLLESGQSVSRATIEAFETTSAIRAERDAWRDQFLDVVLRAVHQEREALEREAEKAYDEAVRAVETT